MVVSRDKLYSFRPPDQDCDAAVLDAVLGMAAFVEGSCPIVLVCCHHQQSSIDLIGLLADRLANVLQARDCRKGDFDCSLRDCERNPLLDDNDFAAPHTGRAVSMQVA